MKLITAIINKKDADSVSDALREKAFRFTKIATYGGFLRAKNLTLLMGVEDGKVDEALDIIRSHCCERMEPLPVVMSEAPYPLYTSTLTEVPVGGATVFITDVVHYERM